MEIIVQRKVEVWVEDIYKVENESQITDALDYNIDSEYTEILWETQKELGPVEVYDKDWNLLYSNIKDE